MKYLLDCDPGIDDAMAIMLLVKSGVDIAGITTVHGNLDAEQTGKNAMKILEHILHRTDIPVAPGYSKPLKGERIDAGHVHGSDGLGETYLPDPTMPFVEAHAVDFMEEKISENKGNITLIAIGPLTNVAGLLQKYPGTANVLAELVIMGGAINMPGNIRPVAEFNIYADPHAASYVFENDTIEKTLVPVDVTRKVVLSPDYLKTQIEKLANKDNRGLAGFLAKIASFYQKFFIEDVVSIGDLYFDGCPMHDPLAVGYAINPDFITKKDDMIVYVETEGQYTKGETVAELRGGAKKELYPNLSVCMDADAQSFLDYFMSTVLS